MYSEAVVPETLEKLPRPATLLKKSLWHKCFPVNFTKFLRTPFFTEHLEWLSSSKWRVTVSGELMFLESYDNCDVTITVLSFYDVAKQFLITISNKHLNSPVINI